jgi:anaerobic ribonucleoside-triphosphate reductase activating protein
MTGTRSLDVILDPLTGRVLVEDPDRLPPALRLALEADLGLGHDVACAVPDPTARLTLPPATPEERATRPCVRLAGYWHGSLIEGPGRRSTAKLQGCPLRCDGCITPDSWDAAGGAEVPVDRLADALLNPAHPRDGVSLAGGEPFHQPEGLLALVRALRERGCPHVLCYSGFTYERLRRMATRRPAIGAVLDEIQVLIDGPFVAALAATAGPWTGSGNQRVIDLTQTRARGAVVQWGGTATGHDTGARRSRPAARGQPRPVQGAAGAAAAPPLVAGTVRPPPAFPRSAPDRPTRDIDGGPETWT